MATALPAPSAPSVPRSPRSRDATVPFVDTPAPDVVNGLLRRAHDILNRQFVNIYEHAMKAYKLFGRGGLVVRFDSLLELQDFVDGKIDMRRATYFDMMQLSRLKHEEIVECVRSYDPFNEFVLVAMVLLRDHAQFGYNVSIYGRKPQPQGVGVMLGFK
jgi:hypothetical protein